MADMRRGGLPGSGVTPVPVRTAWVARAMRPVLWVGVVFNLCVALMLVFPTTLGGFAALPPVGSDFYRWMLVYFVVLFSATYAWLALQPAISQPLIGLAALGKAGVFVVALVCLVRGEVELRTFAVALGDLAFAAYFMAWLRTTGARG
jgi:hypothetical protein